MGQAKHQWEKSTDLQWFPTSEERVCGKCLEDDALAAIVLQHVDSKRCEFCGTESDELIAAPLDAVTEHMAVMINRRYTDPANELPYESREGGYLGEWFDGRELFDEIGYYPSNEALAESIIGCFLEGMWCRSDYFSLEEDERMRLAWSAFCVSVKHVRRFTFWSMGDPHDEDEYHPDYSSVGGMLDELARAIQSAGLIKKISATQDMWRVRVHGATKSISSATELSAPPRDKAIQPNRMSPAGIPMFYGASTYETACAETLDPTRAVGQKVTGGRFRPMRELQMLDLFDLPTVPSFWDEGAADLRDTIIFLRDFENDITKPIDRGRSGHIEYVPTQALSEYVRYQMKTDDEQSIDGIRYRSSKTGEACFVIFCEQDQCVEPTSSSGPSQLLKFDETTLRTDDAPDVVALLAKYRRRPRGGRLF